MESVHPNDDVRILGCVLPRISVVFAYSAGPCTLGAYKYHKIVPRCVDINKKNIDM